MILRRDGAGLMSGAVAAPRVDAARSRPGRTPNPHGLVLLSPAHWSEMPWRSRPDSVRIG